MPESGSGKKPQRYQDLAASSFGIEVAVATLLGGLLGWWLDGRFHTKPWLMLVFLVIGAGVGWVDVWLQVRNMDDETLRKKEK